LIVNGKTSQGVMNDLGEEVLPKGKKYTQKCFMLLKILLT
jgi:DNA-directed RNA polymerase subunit beta